MTPRLPSIRRPRNSSERSSSTVSPRPGTFSSRSMKPSFAFGSPSKMYQNKFVAHFDVHDRKIFRHRRIQARHHDVVVVHLAGMRNHGNGIRLGQRRNLARLRDAAHAVRVELDVVDRARLQQIAKSVQRELVLAAGNRDFARRISARHIRGCRPESPALPASEDETVRAAAACAWRSRASSPCRRRPSHRCRRRRPRARCEPGRHCAACPPRRPPVPSRSAASSPCSLRLCSASPRPPVRSSSTL